MSAFLVIQQAIVDGLTGSPDLAGVVVTKNRTRPMAREVEQAIAVRIESSRDGDGPLGSQDWETTFEVECIARVASGADPAESIDALLFAAWSAVRALRLGLQDVTNLDTLPQIDWAFDAADTQLASATFQLIVGHRTKAESLQPWSE